MAKIFVSDLSDAVNIRLTPTSIHPVTHYGSCQDTGSGVHILPSGLLQLASVWSDRERHEESPVAAECRSTPHHRSQTS